MNRSEKIQLLNDLQSGVKTLSVLKSDSVVVIYKDDVYHITCTDLYLNEVEFECYIKGLRTILLIPDNGTNVFDTSHSFINRTSL